MKTMKKLLALMMCFVMVCSLVPMQALATGTETDIESQTTEMPEPTAPAADDTDPQVPEEISEDAQAITPADSQETTPEDAQDETPADSQDEAPVDSQETTPEDAQDETPADSQDETPEDADTAESAPYQNVVVVIYRNGDTTTPYKTVYLDQVPLGDTFNVSALNIADYYSSANGYAFEGWYNDGGWNNYKAGNKGNTLSDEITINGWTNIVCMVTDHQKVIVFGVTNGDKDNAEVVFNGTAPKGELLVSWLNANVTVPEKTGYTVDKWYNWDWYGHKYDDARTVNGWTNVYVTYTANQYTLTLDPNGGKVDPATITVTYNEAIGTLPAATRSGYIFDGWVDASGKAVTAETVYTLAGDSTCTAQWIRHPGSGSANVTKELFTIQCTTNHEHAWLVNWLGSHVKLVKDSVKWDAENSRWTAQATFSQFSLINSTQTRKNYFGGITHHYETGLKITMDLYYDPNFTGLNSQGNEVTGMWLPVQQYVADVYCYSEPAAPSDATVQKLSKLIWMRDAANIKNYLKPTKLYAGTYTVGEMYTADGSFYANLTITDLAPYIADFADKFGEGYAVGAWELNNTAEDFTYVLKYTGSATDYAQDGTGWTVDWPTTTEKNNGRTLWLTKQYTVTYTDGDEANEIFADQVFTVDAMTETDKDKFTATATPAIEDPTRASYIFAGWEPEVAETITEDVVYTAQWIRHPGSGSANVTKELFTIQCTTNHDHAWLVNWLGSHVSLVKDSVQWDAENSRWTAQATFSAFYLVNMGTTDDNYFGGITHHYENGQKITMDLYYDPNFTGLNSQGKEVTGMWLPVQQYVADVYCYSEPAAPSDATVQKLSKLIWMRDAANIKNYLKPTKLYADTYTVGEMYTENGKFYAKLTITDLAPYIADFAAKYGEGYAVGAWEQNYTAEDFTYILTYTGSTTDYKQDGTGWIVDSSSYASTSEKNNGKTLWLTKQYTVTYTDGDEANEVFADQVFTVDAVTETAKDKFAATATPTIADPVRPGYIFSGWTPEISETVTEDAAYTAVWELLELKVYYTIDGTLVNEFTLTGVDVTAFNVYDYRPTKRGYTLDCWYEKEADIGNSNKAEPNADQDFTNKKVLRLYGSYVANETSSDISSIISQVSRIWRALWTLFNAFFS